MTQYDDGLPESAHCVRCGLALAQRTDYPREDGVARLCLDCRKNKRVKQMETGLAREETRTREDIDAEYNAMLLAQAHAESLPKEGDEDCPDCGSEHVLHYTDRSCTCLECGALFDEPGATLSQIANLPTNGLLTKTAGGLI